MNYNRKILAHIGKEVLDKYPGIASDIMKHVQTLPQLHYDVIDYQLTTFCTAGRIDPSVVKGPVFKSSMTEYKKIFIGVMLNIYGEQYCLKKIISRVLEQQPSATSRMITEVKFRYAKEHEFAAKCNDAIRQLQQPINLN